MGGRSPRRRTRATMFIDEKNPIVLQTDNARKKKHYSLKYTDRIISSMIDSGIWSNFIPTLYKIPTE